MTAVETIGELFASPAARDHLGEPVPIGEHMRQTGALAEAAGAEGAQVADVMQQGGGHQRALRASSFGQRPSLQHVLADRYRLAQMVVRRRGREQLPDRLNRGHGASSRRKTARVLASPSRSA